MNTTIRQNITPYNKEKSTTNFKGRSPLGALVDADTSILKGFTAKKMNSVYDNSTDKFVAVHMTNYAPTNGIIRTTRSATQDKNGVSEYRDTVHFSLNQAVKSHSLGNWDERPYAILSPLKALVKNNKKNTIGGKIVDFFLKKDVKLPPSTIIIRKNSTIPQGKLKVINAETIDELKNTKGIKVIETPNNVKETADLVVEKMGFSNYPELERQQLGLDQKTWNLMTDENAMSELPTEEYINLMIKMRNTKVLDHGEKLVKEWKKYTHKNGFKDYLHGQSPSGRSESIISAIDAIRLNSNTWKKDIKSKSVDYQKEFLTIIDEIKAKKPSPQELTFDIDKLSKIIRTSDSPEEASNRIEKELKLKRMKPANPTQETPTENDIYIVLDSVIGLEKDTKRLFNNY